MANNFRDKLGTLTLDQKIALLSGADFWRTTAVPEAGIPQVKLTDGPNGARGDLQTSVAAACFPVGVALGATWNVELLGEIGSALADEARTKAAHVLLGPTINLQRTPVGGRNFECYSEDPYLTAELAVSYTNALQAKGIGACPKHYVGNDTEHQRMTISSNIDDATLHDVYLYPFERLVKETKPWMIMAAYNAINGVQACSHRALNVDLLKNDWGFDGVIVSDWFAARAGAADANGGLDLEMPGPTRVWGSKLKYAVESGEVAESEIDDKVDRLLHLMERSGVAPDEAVGEERASDDPAHRTLIRRAGAEAMVLLKNDAGTLPLDKTAAQSLTVIGPNAEIGQIMGGGSSFVNSHPPVHPLEGLQSAFAGANLRFETGCTNYKYLPPFKPSSFRSPDGTQGQFLREVFIGHGFDGELVQSDLISSSLMTLLDGMVHAGNSMDSSIRVSGSFRPEDSGLHQLGLFSAGPARLFVDGEEIIDNVTEFAPGESFFGFGSKERRADFTFEKGREYQIVVEYFRPATMPVAGLQFGVAPVREEAEMIAKATEAAKQSEHAILILGSNSDWESEGHDRETLALPGDQDKLAEAVLTANPDTIIVMNIGAPVAMPWYDKAKTVLVVWFLGEEMGNALADVVTGAAEPSGRLPFSWPKRIEDHPAYASYPGAKGQMPYDEGRLIGHRWYDAKGIEPLAPFGFGLGYGKVSIGNMSLLDNDNEGLGAIVQLAVSNSADCDTKAVLQVYAAPTADGVSEDEPLRRLVAFQKVEISAGASVPLEIPISADALATWNADAGKRLVQSGHSFFVGLSSSELLPVLPGTC